MTDNKGRNNDKRLFFELLFIAVVMAAFAIYTLTSESAERFEVSFLDVGNGDAAMLRTPGGDVILIDGGEERNYEDTIVPALSTARRLTADTVIATHFHSDHAGGIKAIVEAGQTKELYMPDAEDSGVLKNELIKGATANKICYEYLSRNDRLVPKDENLKIDVLFPDTDLFYNEERNGNNDSLVLRVKYCDTVFLFTGDLESDAERVLVNSGSLKSNVLKVGHHGSKTSSSESFLNAVKPDFAVISVGKENRYGHPAPEVLKRLENTGAKILRTDQNGRIVFFTSKEGIQEINMKRMTAEQEPKNGNT